MCIVKGAIQINLTWLEYDDQRCINIPFEIEKNNNIVSILKEIKSYILLLSLYISARWWQKSFKSWYGKSI